MSSSESETYASGSGGEDSKSSDETDDSSENSFLNDRKHDIDDSLTQYS